MSSTSAKKNPPVFRNIDSYDTDTENSSDDELLPPNPSLEVPSVQHHYPDPDDMSTSMNAPKDHYNMIYIIFFIQGIGMLLPWNFFITAKDYFDYKFQNDKTVKSKYENTFALASMFPNVISLFLNIFLTGRVSRGLRVITCLLFMLGTFVLTTVFVKIDTHTWPGKFFAITIVSVLIINTSSGVYQGTLFGVAGIVGTKYTQAIMTGQAMAGIFAALADLFSKLASAHMDNPTVSAFSYFLTAAVVIAITAISYTVLFKLPRMQFYFRRFQRHSHKDLKADKDTQQTKNVQKIPYLMIFKEIIPMALSVTTVFAVTLSLFPAVLAKIQSVNKNNGSRWNNDLFPTLACFLLFNVGDWCGRTLAGQIQIVSSKGPWLLLLCLSRVVFIPLFLMCNVPGNHLPYVFKHDAWPVLINSLFSISNGYLASLSMMYGPKLVAIEHAETAGTIMSLFLSIGLTIGACISFAL